MLRNILRSILSTASVAWNIFFFFDHPKVLNSKLLTEMHFESLWNNHCKTKLYFTQNINLVMWALLIFIEYFVYWAKQPKTLNFLVVGGQWTGFFCILVDASNLVGKSQYPL